MCIRDRAKATAQPFPRKAGHRFLGLREPTYEPGKQGTGQDSAEAIHGRIPAFGGGPLAKQRQNRQRGGAGVWGQLLEPEGLETAVWTDGCVGRCGCAQDGRGTGTREPAVTPGVGSNDDAARHFKKNNGHFVRRLEERYRMIEEQSQEYPIRELCAALQVSR